MPDREDILRRARIINYDRYYTPRRTLLDDPTFEYEYVHSYRITPVEGGHMIHDVHWRVGNKRDYSGYPNEIQRMIQNNEIRARKELKTVELRKYLEEENLPLRFVFPEGIDVVVLPKLNNLPNKVYIKWSDSQTNYQEQRLVDFRSELYNKWFNSEKANSEHGQDWRYLLRLNWPDIEPIDVLYKYFEGVYTGDLETLQQEPKKPGNKRRIKETYQDKIRIKNKEYAESQKQVCLMSPTGEITRMQKFKTGPFLKKGYVFASKEDYKRQNKINFEKRKDMAEGNRQHDLEKKKELPRIIRRGTKQKGIQGSPFRKYQTIAIQEIDAIDSTLVAQETVEIRINVPQYMLIARTSKDGTFMNWKRIFTGNKEEWFTVTRDVPIQRKTIKVMQVPSKNIQDLKSIMAEPTMKIEGLLRKTVETPFLKHLKMDSKEGVPRWTKQYAEKKIEPKYETYIVTKRDKFGIRYVTKRKLVS